MAITEEGRHEIYEAFKASHGAKVANGLMELLPPVGWADVATKHDLAVLRGDGELLRGDIEHLRGEVELLRGEGKADLALVEARLGERLGHEIGFLEARLGERLERELRRQSARYTASLFAGLTLFGVVQRLT